MADTITIQDTETAPIAPAPIETGWLGNLAPMVLIFVVFYFLLIRPQEKKKKEHEKLISGVKKGEDVVTNSGIFGAVTAVNDSDNTVLLQISQDVEIKILKSAIVDIVSRAENSKPKSAKDKKSVKSKK